MLLATQDERGEWFCNRNTAAASVEGSRCAGIQEGGRYAQKAPPGES